MAVDCDDSEISVMVVNCEDSDVSVMVVRYDDSISLVEVGVVVVFLDCTLQNAGLLGSCFLIPFATSCRIWL